MLNSSNLKQTSLFSSSPPSSSSLPPPSSLPSYSSTSPPLFLSSTSSLPTSSPLPSSPLFLPSSSLSSSSSPLLKVKTLLPVHSHHLQLWNSPANDDEVFDVLRKLREDLSELSKCASDSYYQNDKKSSHQQESFNNNENKPPCQHYNTSGCSHYNLNYLQNKNGRHLRFSGNGRPPLCHHQEDKPYDNQSESCYQHSHLLPHPDHHNFNHPHLQNEADSYYCCEMGLCGHLEETRECHTHSIKDVYDASSIESNKLTNFKNEKCEKCFSQIPPNTQPSPSSSSSSSSTLSLPSLSLSSYGSVASFAPRQKSPEVCSSTLKIEDDTSLSSLLLPLNKKTAALPSQTAVRDLRSPPPSHLQMRDATDDVEKINYEKKVTTQEESKRTPPTPLLPLNLQKGVSTDESLHSLGRRGSAVVMLPSSSSTGKRCFEEKQKSDSRWKEVVDVNKKMKDKILNHLQNKSFDCHSLFSRHSSSTPPQQSPISPSLLSSPPSSPLSTPTSSSSCPSTSVIPIDDLKKTPPPHRSYYSSKEVLRKGRWHI